MAIIRNKRYGYMVEVPVEHPCIQDQNWEVVTLEDVLISELKTPDKQPEPEAQPTVAKPKKK